MDRRYKMPEKTRRAFAAGAAVLVATNTALVDVTLRLPGGRH